MSRDLFSVAYRQHLNITLSQCRCYRFLLPVTVDAEKANTLRRTIEKHAPQPEAIFIICFMVIIKIKPVPVLIPGTGLLVNWLLV
jgi:hypothetical protein